MASPEGKALPSSSESSGQEPQDLGTMNHEATELPGESSNQAHERMRDSSSTVTRQADFLDLISDDGASVQGANLDMPPAYGNHPQEINIDRDGFQASAANAYDGRVDIKINSSARRLSRIFEPAIQNQLEYDNASLPPFSPLSGDAVGVPTPRINIVIQVVGSRGDIQPFISLGLRLKLFGHRVRIATHRVFQKFVEEFGLEFFNIGGNPAELMAYMVNNPGILPTIDTIRAGEVQKRRRGMREILRGCWRSCIEAGNGLDQDPDATADGQETRKDPKPFVAEAIIANPPTFAHLHCAEKLGVPLHLMFTMPWSSTQAFPHPLANIKSSNQEENVTNYLSYILVEIMTWQGLGDVINRFRKKVLGLDPMELTRAPGMISRLGIPYTYCWSPSLIPKPRDWGRNISIAGFYFLSCAPSYEPSAELLSFLEAGPPPVYIGFGSIVVDDPDALTEKIFEAIRMAGVRALVSKGWGGLGGTSPLAVPDVFMIGNCPHDWLFERVACVVHHGGAGTTAAGIAAGKPTVVVPFFGDQPFWGNVIFRARAGPQPIPFKALTASNLADAIKTALEPATLQNASLLGDKIRTEQGSDNGVRSFHDRLPLARMGCSLGPHRVAVWKVRKTDIRLSAMAATVLRKEGLLDFHKLKLFRPCEYNTYIGPYDPFSGSTLALFDLFYDVFKGVGEIGSEFVRVPSVTPAGEGSSDASKMVHYPPQQAVTVNKENKMVGMRAAKGVTRLTKASVRSPMTLTVALADGAHNVPKMWGDKTVRPQEKITGIGSGLKAAGKEFVYGTYDGVSGLFTQPVLGAREEGPLGAVKGLGKGLMGSVFKPLAAMSGTVGYPLKGIDAQIQKALMEKTFAPITSARMTQGEIEYTEASAEERQDIIDRWHLKLAEKQKNKKKARADQMSVFTSDLRTL